MKDIIIDKKRIGKNQPVFIIAEAGVNHNGSLSLAKKMIDVAKFAGADAVKFQTFVTERLVIENAPKAAYQKRGFSGKSQFTMLKSLELSQSNFRKLFTYCREKKINFLSTPFDSQSADFLHKLGISAFKISSGELTNVPLLRQVSKYQKPIILSTGMSTLSEVKETLKAIYSTGNKKLILLHCTSSYPTGYEDANLKAMETLRKKFNCPIGYSDHTQGIEVAVAAVALGASIIEKHFTLNKNLQGPDHKISLEPDEFKKMVQSIRNIEEAMGNGLKIPQKSEFEIRKIARKSIVAACDIPRGTKLTSDVLAVKRPGTGIEPKYFNNVIGKAARHNIKKDALIKFKDLS